MAQIINPQEWGIEDDLCNQLFERTCHDRTPDFLDLKSEHFIPVFVYGTLKVGGYFHHTLEGLPYLGEAMTQTAAFTMQETEGYPVAYHVCNPQDKRMKHRGKLLGEVFVVDPKTMLTLDRIEDNGRMYTRKLMYVKLMNQGQGSHNLIKAWIYVGVDKYWLDAQDMVTNVQSQNSSAGPVYEWIGKDTKQKQDREAAMMEYIENSYEVIPPKSLDDRIPF